MRCLQHEVKVLHWMICVPCYSWALRSTPRHIYKLRLVLPLPDKVVLSSPWMDPVDYSLLLILQHQETAGLVIRFCISEEGWKILLLVVCKMLKKAKQPLPQGGTLQAKNTGRLDTKERMRRQRWRCMAGSIWGVSASFMLGDGKSLLPEIAISLQESEARASSGPAAGRSAWPHWGDGEKCQGLNAGQKKMQKRKDRRLLPVLTVMPNG